MGALDWREGLECGSGSGEAALTSEDNGMSAVASTQLVEQVVNVRLYRRLADNERTGDLGVGTTLCDEEQYLMLTVGQARFVCGVIAGLPCAVCPWGRLCIWS